MVDEREPDEGGAEAEVAEAPSVDEGAARKKKRHKRRRPSKRYRASRERVGLGRPTYNLDEAIKLLKALKGAKFDETVELHVKIGVDPRKSDQQVRGTFVYPHGIGKEKRVVAFAEGVEAEQARAAGAIEVGGAELAKRMEEGWLDFDVVVAHFTMMKVVGRLGRVLGPRGLMPNKKTGTIVEKSGSVEDVVRDFSAGKIAFRVDEGANVHVPAGKRSFPLEKLQENIEAFLLHLGTLKPPTAKGIFIQKASIAATMSPGVRIAIDAFR
jgi:large subunit ribosomal protein L1